MLIQLVIENFQSHEKTALEFCSGINTIVGSSNSGKSAILRALYWVVYNKPGGFGFSSHWNLDKKGALKDPVQVALQVTGAPLITRKDLQIIMGILWAKKN